MKCKAIVRSKQFYSSFKINSISSLFEYYSLPFFYVPTSPKMSSCLLRRFDPRSGIMQWRRKKPGTMASGAAPVAPDLSARPLATDMRFLFLVLAATALQAGKSATLKIH